MTDKVIYTAKTHTTGGRDNGHAKSSDGQLDVHLSVPGANKPGTNPEQLFAAAWSACFEGALRHVALLKKAKLSPDVAVDAEIDLHNADGQFFVGARLNITIPDLERGVAQSLVDDAIKVCPYSKATKGNIDVKYTLV